MESSAPANIGLQDRLMPYVNRVLAIEDVTTGGPKDSFLGSLSRSFALGGYSCCL